MIPAPSPAITVSAVRPNCVTTRPFANKYVLGAEPYVYFEAGQTWYIQRGAAIDPSLIDQSIDSVGGGVRFSLPYNASLGLEVAQTLHAVTGSDAGKQATKLFVTTGVRF